MSDNQSKSGRTDCSFTIEEVQSTKRGRIKCNFTYKGKTVYHDLPSGLFKKLKEISEGPKEIEGPSEDEIRNMTLHILKTQSKILAIKYVRKIKYGDLSRAIAYVNNLIEKEVFNNSKYPH